jgi:hypothetical protein
VKVECVQSLLALGDCSVDHGGTTAGVFASRDFMWGDVPYSHEVVGVTVDAVCGGRGW